ncbi:hypothetical protein [Streptomyces albus]|uniref:hypothetical protein n=1 Tax=Streptomyces albus TaxID=1888 RepID=UPI0006E163A2|nr:hypothetical protein [Streptomyces albus]
MSTQIPGVKAYLVDESTATSATPPWAGRVIHVWPDSGCRLITATGYAWTAAPGDLRPATEEERAAYDAQVRGIRRERAALYRQLRGGTRS